MSDEHIAWFRAGSALNVLRGELTPASVASSARRPTYQAHTRSWSLLLWMTRDVASLPNRSTQ